MVVDPAREFFEPLYLSVDPLLVLFCPLSASVSAGQNQFWDRVILFCYFVRIKQFDEKLVVSSVPGSIPSLGSLRTGFIRLHARSASFLDPFTDKSLRVSARYLRGWKLEHGLN
jgi:hypothetical protein